MFRFKQGPDLPKEILTHIQYEMMDVVFEIQRFNCTIPVVKRSAPLRELLAKDCCFPPIEMEVSANENKLANVIGPKAENWAGSSILGCTAEYD